MSERVAVINIAIEGQLLAGAFVAVVVMLAMPATAESIRTPEIVAGDGPMPAGPGLPRAAPSV